MTKAGFVALIGAPNAGKSTLLNCLVGEKLSIVSHKAQTTRMRVLGLVSDGETQMGLIDTPGLFTPHARLDSAMVEAAWGSLDDADAIVLLVDAAARAPLDKIAPILERLSARKGRLILALNKIDRLARPRLLPFMQECADLALFDEIFPLSATTGEGVEALKTALLARMPEGPWLYPEDQLTDLPERLFAAEMTREQLFLQLHDELPYGAIVLPKSWEEKPDGSVVIRQTIVIAKAAHRPIVLGKSGARIKAIGAAARAAMAEALERKVHLFLDVDVDETWQNNPAYYEMFGLTYRKK